MDASDNCFAIDETSLMIDDICSVLSGAVYDNADVPGAMETLLISTLLYPVGCLVNMVSIMVNC